MENYNTPLYMTKRDFLYRVPSNEDVNRLWEKVLQFRRGNGIKISFEDQLNKSRASALGYRPRANNSNL